MTTMAMAFRPVIEQVLAEREADMKKAVIVTKTLNTKGNLNASAKWNHKAWQAQQDVLELRRRARVLARS